MVRAARRDITLCDGTRIHKGAIVSAAVYPLHRDDAMFENAGMFDPFRFARIHAAAGTEDNTLNLQATITSQEYLPFGHGPYAWCVCHNPRCYDKDAAGNARWLTCGPRMMSME